MAVAEHLLHGTGYPVSAACELQLGSDMPLQHRFAHIASSVSIIIESADCVVQRTPGGCIYKAGIGDLPVISFYPSTQLGSSHSSLG